MQLEGEKKFVVVSAMGAHPTSPIKVTDLLLNMMRKAAARDSDYLSELDALKAKHVSTAEALLDDGTEAGAAELAAFRAQLEADMEGVQSILKAIVAGARLLPPFLFS